MEGSPVGGRQGPGSVSVIIPAFNEAQVIGRLLDGLAVTHLRPQFDVVVACNGCTDDTETVAGRHPLRPRVVSIPQGSKFLALQAGDEAAELFPRFYIDADVVITAEDLLSLADVLTSSSMLAVCPERELDLRRSSWFVRAYYRVWQRLPVVTEGLFGRGVLGVTKEGFARLVDRPDVLGDDLYFHQRFAPEERAIVRGTHVMIQAPRTMVDLLRRRIRISQGNTQLADPAHTATTPTSSGDLLRLVRADVRIIPGVVVFLLVTVAARTMARGRRPDSPWLRDESSRA